MIKLSGIFPPVPTAFDPDENLAVDKMRDNLRRLSKFDLAGFLILGSNGEKVMLSEREQREVLDSARAAITQNKLMLAGTGEQSTRATIDLTKAAAASGADAALVLNPSYYRGQMTAQALIAHYSEVADASPIPVIVYNMPACSGLDLTADIVIQLSRHSNIVGIKDSGGNISKIAEIVRGAEPGFQVLAGSASFLLPALSVGAVGGVLALANIAPRQCIEVLSSYHRGDLEKAREVQFSLIPLNQAITATGGVPALKAAMDHLGLYGGPSRSPLLPPDEDRLQAITRLLESHEIRI
jgi:4-hydroxy-2-oxoglutarate aldolase